MFWPGQKAPPSESSAARAAREFSGPWWGLDAEKKAAAAERLKCAGADIAFVFDQTGDPELYSSRLLKLLGRALFARVRGVDFAGFYAEARPGFPPEWLPTLDAMFLRGDGAQVIDAELGGGG